jgi:Ca-activated chloride channel family protein
MRAGPFMSGVAWLFAVNASPAFGGGTDPRAVLPPVQYMRCELPAPPIPSRYGGGYGALPPSPAPSVAAASPPAAPGGAVSISSTTTGQVLTREILTNIPTGRSYQSAAAVVEGTPPGGHPPAVPSLPVSSYNENTYMLDGAQITDPVPQTDPGPAFLTSDSGRRDGHSVWLSNDDPSSLASAQRALWAAGRGTFPSADEIRPHELLNAWPWTPAGASEEQFSVRAVARAFEPGQLTVGVTVTAPTAPRAPTDVTLVVDRSGSMSASDRMPLVQQALRQLARSLSPGDRVDLVLFDHDVCAPVRGFVVGRDPIEDLESVIGRISPRGSTDLHTGLRTGYEIATYNQASTRRPQRVMLFTDAELNTGVVDARVTARVSAAAMNLGIALTGVGVGYSMRDDVLDRLTEEGRGAYVFLASDLAVREMFGSRVDALLTTVAVDVRYRLDLPPGLSMHRFFGEEWSTRAADVRPVHATAGATTLFLSDLLADAEALDGTIDLVIQWRDPVTNTQREQRERLSIRGMLGAPDADLRAARALMAWSAWMAVGAEGGGRAACGQPAITLRSRLAEAPSGLPWGEVVDDHAARVCGTATGSSSRAWPPPAPFSRVSGAVSAPVPAIPAASFLGVIPSTWTDGSPLWPGAITANDRRPRCRGTWDPTRCR